MEGKPSAIMEKKRKWFLYRKPYFYLFIDFIILPIMDKIIRHILAMKCTYLAFYNATTTIEYCQHFFDFMI
jgi:hypothetical protein